MLKSQIFPESYYEFKLLSFEQIKRAYSECKTITGYVEALLTDKKELIVKLGDGIIGHLPFSEVTIYPHTYSKNPSRTLPVQICTLLHKKIRVKVTHIDENTITLSRKANMEEAHEYIKTCSSVLFHITSIIPSIAFGDIGDGINARLHILEVCKARLKSITEYFHRNDMVWVKVKSFDSKKGFCLSYKDTFAPYCPDNFHVGDVFEGKIGQPVDTEHSGYYVDIFPNVTGIMDATILTPLLRYGDKVECYVYKADKAGLKLKFVRLK